jgi:hypothetical protein
MSALSDNNAALITRDSADVRIGKVKSSTAVYMNSFVMRDSTSYLVPLGTVAGTFDGIISQGVTTTATVRDATLARKGYVKGYLASVAITDVGKPVYCSTDNPGDITLTWTATAKQVGVVSSLFYDSAGAVSNYCWVYFDADMMADAKVLTVAGSAHTQDAATVDRMLYAVPVGRQAKVLGGTWEVGAAAPSNVTTCDLCVKKISGTTRTTIAGPVNIKSYATVDLTVALTLSTVSGAVSLTAGDRLIGSVDCQGTAAAYSDVKLVLTVAEWPQG